MKKYTLALPLLLFFHPLFSAKTPKLTVIFVIDQLAYHYFNKLDRYFTGGIKWLKDNGVFYTNTIMPHGMPATGVGHTALNTGAWAKDHGIVNNTWADKEGKTIKCDQDNSGTNRVFSPTGLYDYGISPNHILVNGISDYFAASSTAAEPHHTYSISLKSRAAVGTANKGGKAIWFDAIGGQFTSSTFYFNTLPDWVKQFNNTYQFNNIEEYTWKLAHNPQSGAYDFPDVTNYSYSQQQSSMINVPFKKDIPNKIPFLEQLENTPFMGKVTFDLAKECINTILQPNSPDKLLLWVCISGLDKIGHIYGSHTKEVIDTIYHIDLQLQDFINFIDKKVGITNTLFAFTADHGIVLTPEIGAQHNYTNAQRINIHELCSEINNFVKCKYNLPEWHTKMGGPNLYFVHPTGDPIEPATYTAILEDIVTLLKQKPYIKNAWTYEQLNQQIYPQDSIEDMFKKQLYPGRSGSIIVLTQPHVLITKRERGVDHKTPYEQNTHVPLIVYWPGMFEKKMVTKPTSILQIPKTIAQIVGCDFPDVAPRNMLPGLFEY